MRIWNLMKMAESPPKRVENTVGRGKIARFEQFLLFPHVFGRYVLQTCKNQGLLGKGLIHYICISNLLTHPFIVKYIIIYITIYVIYNLKFLSLMNKNVKKMNYMGKYNY